MRPVDKAWENWSIAGVSTVGSVPPEYRRPWTAFSSDEINKLIEHVRANRSKIAFNSDNRSVKRTLEEKNATDLLVEPGSREHRG
mmetsp:Transcript_16223/g.37502  ORF Transcript_16223/g.37502 Transcript_16223/m.37502 type:complete len:85 (+) Transcript_16223:2200-2454(+)